MKRPSLPPLTRAQFAQLRADAADIRATAKRKNVTLDRWDEHQESEAARKHFDLGCWLFYYSNRIGRTDAAGLVSRIDCARRIFEAGITSPGYRFFTIFDFGERQFDTIVEMGDANQVLNGLREAYWETKNPNLAKAFEYNGWPLPSERPTTQPSQDQLALL